MHRKSKIEKRFKMYSLILIPEAIISNTTNYHHHHHQSTNNNISNHPHRHYTIITTIQTLKVSNDSITTKYTRKYMHAETLALLTKPLYFPNMKYLK
jgi:hypothetical protein